MTDLEAMLRAAAPAGSGRPPALPETDVSMGTVGTPVGTLVVAATEDGVVACSYEPEARVAERVATAISPRVLRHPRRIDAVRRQLDAYFAGRRQWFSLAVDLRLAGEFGRAVLRTLDDVPYGRTTTYGRIAARVGRPRAARAVGNVLTTNPVCVIVPCHRVVPSGGGLGGYAGGVPAKEHLLEHEAQRG